MGLLNASPTPFRQTTPVTCNDRVKLIQSCDKWIIGKYKCHNEGYNVTEAIINGTAIAVNDGSYKQN